MTGPMLKGPTDADYYRVNVGRSRYYADPLPSCDIAEESDEAWVSVSKVKKASGSDWSFVERKRTAKALAANPRVFDGLGTVKEISDRIRSINQTDLDRASDRGTNVHTYFERGLLGEPIEPFTADEPGAEYVPAVRSFFAAYEPELVATELVCINRSLHDHGYGGTGDAIVRFHAGPLAGSTVWIDWKSRGEDSKHGAYPEEACQLGAYYEAEYCIAEGPDGAPMRKRLPDVDGGLIVSIKPDSFRPYPIHLGKAALQWRQLHRWWVARLTERDPIGKPLAPVAMKDPIPDLIAAASSRDLVLALWKAHRARWTAHHDALAKAHLATL